MKGLNKIMLIGNLGKDPEIVVLDDKIKVAKFNLATNENFKDENGQIHNHTEWHNIVLWRGLADLTEKYLRKGMLVHIEGKNRTRSYDDKQGIKRYLTEIIVEDIIILDKNES